MASIAAAKGKLDGISGLIFFGFPLHAPGRDSSERGNHLKEVNVRMLFLQGTRDKLAKIELIKPLCKSLGRKTKLHIFEGADHSFKTRKMDGVTHEEVLEEMTEVVVRFVSS